MGYWFPGPDHPRQRDPGRLQTHHVGAPLSTVRSLGADDAPAVQPELVVVPSLQSIAKQLVWHCADLGVEPRGFRGRRLTRLEAAYDPLFDETGKMIPWVDEKP